MSHTPHELADDFPQYADKITTLKQSDPHFSQLADDYHDINRAVHRAETDVEPTSDQALVDMRKTRLDLKDKIYAYLSDS